MRTLVSFGLASVCVAAMTVAVWADPPQAREGMLQVGSTAPDFAVKDVQGKTTVTLSDLKGKPVVLIFGSCT